ncbi:cyclic peptide export ABC transporter [Scytonema sp. PCC 10023]|uniref:cyclic peptide export ABC transporter n=1 Tax=Scytonema sp. PCC 10023 TaxID=1680591 RepID=UPI0039C5C002
MNIIRLLLQTSWLVVALAAIASFISGASSVGLIALINTVLSRGHSSTVTPIFWRFFSLCLLLLVARFASQVLLVRLSQRAIFDLRMLLSRRILASPLRRLEEIGAPQLLTLLTDDVQSVSNAFFVIPILCVDSAIVAGCLIYMSWLSKTMFLVMLGFLVLGMYSYQVLERNARHSLVLAREEQGRLFKHFRAITEGIKELKLHHQRRQAFLSQYLQPTAASYRHHNVVGMTTFAAAASWGQLLFFIAIGLFLFGLSCLIEVKSSILSGYVLTIVYLMTPLAEIMSVLPSWSRASVALKKVESLGLGLATYSAEGGSIAQPTSQFAWKCLELAGVTHAYRGERGENNFILGPIDLKLHPGELVFLVGGNGSGKSTLAKLITGLYIPETGKVYLDEKLITDENLEWYRQHFSAVFSDFYLFEKILGLSSCDLKIRTRDYLAKLQLEHKVQVKNGVFSTTDLSQGQRKRLALLTVSLENRPIYVFDEWASDQDPIFKEIFYTQILQELKSRGKTALVISHDERYFYLADRLFKLDYGKLEYKGERKILKG